MPITAQTTSGICMRCFRQNEQQQIGERAESELVGGDVLDCCLPYITREISHQYKHRAKERFRERYTALLAFLRENGLLRKSDFGLDVEDWTWFAIRRSDLTDEGARLWDKCFTVWLVGLDRGNKTTYLSRWKKEFEKMKAP